MKQGHIADLRLDDAGGAVYVGVHVRPSGDLAGAIDQRVDSLLRCLKTGHRFIARFTAISGGRHDVRIEPVV